MALNEKWGALFGDDSSGSGAAMRLASADAHGGGGDSGAPDLKASGGPWTTASGVANALHTSSASALTELETAAKVEAKSTAGLDCTTAMGEVLGSWKVRLTAVRDECQRLEGSLKSAGKEFGEREVVTRKKFEGRAGGPK
ncbi:hypothetical protein FBY35_2669 [Streptomyces sp. SLBN-118]|uniref:hypothetical protein n=1 Tax=Streptomyces sp. SLBN-118 TaxID=2768454 RepID=UPI0011516BC9|nr:hypothetical protein [Streptomyces sp. SLBN-118]TQK52238.1 hypothetical protein FBY35_2669 [Streptomyces sp. SLBN-118]